MDRKYVGFLKELFLPSPLSVLWRIFFSLTIAWVLLTRDYLTQLFKDLPNMPSFPVVVIATYGFPYPWVEYVSPVPRIPQILWHGLVIDVAFWLTISYLGTSVIMAYVNKTRDKA